MLWKLSRRAPYLQPASMTKRNIRSEERGSGLIEFLLSSLIWLPLLLGTAVFGVNMIRAIQVSQIARNSAHMFSQGIDFSQPQNAALLVRMASGLNIQQKSGSGGILLSTM